MRLTGMEEKPEGPGTPGISRKASAPSDPQSVPDGIPVDVEDRTWEHSVEKSRIPVVVMFYSPACPFCHQMDPPFRNYAGEYRGVVLFARLNSLTSPWTAGRYGIKSTPTFTFFCKGKPVRELVGAVYPALLKKTIDEVLLHGKECSDNPTAIDYEITGYG